VCSIGSYGQEVIFPWVVYYGSTASSKAFEPYNPIVLDSEAHPDLEPLLNMKKEVLGYVNMAEMIETDPLFSTFKTKKLLIQKNPQWPRTWAVDIRDPIWKALLLNTVIPKVVSQGFTGLFLDQLDVALELEELDSNKYKGMKQAAIDLVIAIKTKFPGKRMMMNRAYEILSDVGSFIDYELAETLYTMYDFTTKKCHIRAEDAFEWQLAKLNSARSTFPHLAVFSLEYFDPKDTLIYDKIYKLERKMCIRPYISVPALDRIVREPAR
jgi:uncharacterized protein (TIGR01370 family)